VVEYLQKVPMLALTLLEKLTLGYQKMIQETQQ